MVKLIFVGSPLLDICAKCDMKTLMQFGLQSDGTVKATDDHDDLFQTLFNDSSSELTSGGSAQNSARVCKWILGDKAEVSFTGCTGKDTFEKWLREKLLSDGVKPLYVYNSELKTGSCACLLIGENDRSMITRHEAAATFSTQHLRIEQIQSHLSQAHFIYVEGYFIGHSPEVVLVLANSCSPTQIFAMSLSAEYICREHTETLLKVLPRVNILFGNEAEVKAFAEALGAAPHTVEDAIAFINQRQRTPGSSRIMITTRGSKPIIVDDGSGELRNFDVASNVSMVNSVGCGDALAGGFLGAYALTKDLELSVNTGIRAATEIAQMKGCNLPSYKIFDSENVSRNLCNKA